MQVNEKGYILCPCCKRPTKTRANPDTELKRLPLFCPWCKKENIINK